MKNSLTFHYKASAECAVTLTVNDGDPIQCKFPLAQELSTVSAKAILRAGEANTVKIACAAPSIELDQLVVRQGELP